MEYTLSNVTPELVIGDLRMNPPIIQGGMGVRVSGPSLASAVSNTGALGVIASVGLCTEAPYISMDYETGCANALRDIIRNTRLRTSNPIGVNIMCVLSNYNDLVRVADDEEVEAIISGAGLPLRLPSLVKNDRTRLVPIVSSARAASLICRTWLKRYHRLPDAIVVEGWRAGGHLGFNWEEIESRATSSLETIVTEVLGVTADYRAPNGSPIPVIAAGGIFDGADIARFLRLGASGVQMGSRFVCTHECDAAWPYKEAYLSCKEEDIVVIRSPVGLPARVIKNRFVERLVAGEKVNFGCPYHCLTPCDPRASSYCIAQALVNAYRGNLDEGYAMCGSNAWRINKVVSVGDLIEELRSGCACAFGRLGAD